jgi:hypothetical protein
LAPFTAVIVPCACTFKKKEEEAAANKRKVVDNMVAGTGRWIEGQKVEEGSTEEWLAQVRGR